METIFTKQQKEKVKVILDSEYSKLSFLNTQEKEMIGIISSFYSAKIEGNTYTLLETEDLLKYGVTAEKGYNDATMLKNLHNCYNLLFRQIQKGEVFKIDKAFISNVHLTLSDGLLDSRERGIFRQREVMVGSANYKPLATAEEIEREFNKILENQENFNEPIEIAIYLHCNLARLQPFIDCNKRTARMVENVVLLQNNLIPLYSQNAIDLNSYVKALRTFYETKNYSPYVDYFLDKQIEQINKFSKKK